METIAAAGFDPTQYIRFYNLRNYDRVNGGTSAATGATPYGTNTDQYQQHQAGVSQVPQPGLGTDRWDTVSECYMLGGEDIRNIPWENGNLSEIDAFVSEELYIHSKVQYLLYRE